MLLFCFSFLSFFSELCLNICMFFGLVTLVVPARSATRALITQLLLKRTKWELTENQKLNYD